MMWAGSICPGPGEQELGVLRWEAYANLTLQRPHLTSAGNNAHWCMWVGGEKESKDGNEQKKELMKERIDEWELKMKTVLRLENVSWRLTYESQKDAQLEKTSQSYHTIGCGFLWIRAARFQPWYWRCISERWDEWRVLPSPQWHNCIWRYFLLDSWLHAHSLCQPSASLFRLITVAPWVTFKNVQYVYLRRCYITLQYREHICTINYHVCLN